MRYRMSFLKNFFREFGDLTADRENERIEAIAEGKSNNYKEAFKSSLRSCLIRSDPKARCSAQSVRFALNYLSHFYQPRKFRSFLFWLNVVLFSSFYFGITLKFLVTAKVFGLHFLKLKSNESLKKGHMLITWKQFPSFFIHESIGWCPTRTEFIKKFSCLRSFENW